MKIFNNEKSELTGIFFQDSLMKSVFGGYPEVLMIDATYKLNKFHMPLYILLVIDGNGLSENIGIFLTSVETEDAITWFLHLNHLIHHGRKPRLFCLIRISQTERYLNKGVSFCIINYLLISHHEKFQEKNFL